MAEPGQGYSGSDDSTCFNCGARGHWAVACPEPTRRTPAGLANAVRHSPNTPHGNVHHSQRGPKRSNKGLVITKYAPPPPPPSLPHSSIGPGAPPYPPPAGPAYQQPNPQFQNSFPHHPPPIHYSASYGHPTYPPAPYPPSSYVAPPAAPVGYAAHPPGPPAPAPAPAPYPPSYGSYPSHVGPAGSPGYPPSAVYPPSYPQASYGPPPVHYPPRGAPAHHSPPAATPPKPPRSSHTQSSLKEPVNSSLPPKPPKSIHTQHEPQRDHRNKRKHDRQNHKHRDNRRKDQGGRRRSHQKMQNKANHAGSAAGSSRKASIPTNTNGPKDPKFPLASGLGKNAGSESDASTNTVEMPPTNNREESHQDDGQSPHPHAEELDEESLIVDEHFENHSEDGSENTAQGFVTNTGAVSEGENEPRSQNPQDSGYDNISTPSSHHSDKPRVNGKHRRLDDESEDEQRPKKAKSSDSLTNGQNGASSRKETHDVAQQAQGDDSPPEQEDQEDDQILPTLESRSRSRSRSRERYQKPRSKSRNSSVSSRSSDLNSLEAELLGRPDKRSSAEPSPPRQRRDSVTIPKMQRRRQQNADSAYSRRW